MVIDGSGWLLITALMTVPMIIVQRAERSRRVLTAVIMAAASYFVLAYGIYRMSRNCDQFIRNVCNLPQLRDKAMLIATNTTILALVSAFVVAFLFWLLVGRYNPPGSSDSIRVLGLND